MEKYETDLILAEYMDNKITLKELLDQFPEMAEEAALLNFSNHAMDSLADINTTKRIEMPVIVKTMKINNKKTWYAAASILFVAVLVLFLVRNQGTDNSISAQLNSIKTDEKIKGLWATQKQTSVTKNTKEKIWLLATNDKNSTVRYLALEILMELRFQLPERDIIINIKKEHACNNQTAWMEYWITIYPGGTNEFLKWLETEGINPGVKSYGMSLIKSTARL